MAVLTAEQEELLRQLHPLRDQLAKNQADRERLLAERRDLFLTASAAGLSVRQIGAAAGVSNAAVSQQITNARAGAS